MNVVVAAGGTLAPIDDVRHIANISTGRFGAAIAEAALRRGAGVWHIHTPYALLPFDRLARFDLTTADPAAEFARLTQLRAESLTHRDRLHSIPIRSGTVAEYSDRLESTLRDCPIDLVFLAMAASDFAPEPILGKIPSDSGALTLRCHRLPKVIRSVRDWSPGCYLIGFKLLADVTTGDLVRQAAAACLINRADLTVANDLRSLRDGRHTIHLVRPDHPVETVGPNPDLADILVDRVLTWAAEKRANGG